MRLAHLILSPDGLTSFAQSWTMWQAAGLSQEGKCKVTQIVYDCQQL